MFNEYQNMKVCYLPGMQMSTRKKNFEPSIIHLNHNEESEPVSNSWEKKGARCPASIYQPLPLGLELSIQQIKSLSDNLT